MFPIFPSLSQRLPLTSITKTGVAAAHSLADYARLGSRKSEEILAAGARLRSARPTAVNLMFAIDAMLQVLLPVPDYSPEKYIFLPFNIIFHFYIISIVIVYLFIC